MLRPIWSAVLVLVVLGTLAPARAADRIRDPHARRFGGESCIACHQPAALPAAGTLGTPQTAGTLGTPQTAGTLGTPQTPGTPATERYDVVIVGGGMAGLSALHYAKKNGRSALLLEAEKEAGGQMRADTWKGITFAKGAAYFVEPYGTLREFYEKEKIPFVKIAEPENSALIGGRFFANCWTSHGRGHMPWSADKMVIWKKFLEEMEEVNNTNRSNQPFDSFDPDQRLLDEVSAYDHLKRRGFTDEMISHLDRYIPSCFGETSKRVSMAAFVNYISGEIGGNYTLPGGLGGVTRIIANNHRANVRLGCRVTRITQTLTSATVDYVDDHGRPQTVGARTVITAVPCNLLPEIIPDLPREKVEVIRKTKYAAYMVAAVLCREVLWDNKGYDTWIDGTFFNDIIDATWISRGGKPYENKKQPHVLSLYIPLGVGGMNPMMNWPPKKFEQAILKDLERVIPGSRRKVEGIRLYRWGHSMHVAEPGFMTRSVPILRKPYYRIFFAGAEVEGLPCNESAILSGYQAVRGIETFLWNTQPPAAAR